MAEHRNTLGTDYWRHAAASSIRNHKWTVTISVILASSSCHELEYPFTLALFKVEMGSLTVDAAQDFNAPSWSPTETIY